MSEISGMGPRGLRRLVRLTVAVLIGLLFIIPILYVVMIGIESPRRSDPTPSYRRSHPPPKTSLQPTSKETWDRRSSTLLSIPFRPPRYRRD